MLREISFVAKGTPRPQGSKSVGRNGQMFEASKQLRDWRNTLKEAAVAARQRGTRFMVAALVVEFVFERPKSHYRSGKFSRELNWHAPIYHTQKPDLDKLVRAVGDSVTDACLVPDDSAITHTQATKLWVDRHAGIGSHARIKLIEVAGWNLNGGGPRK